MAITAENITEIGLPLQDVNEMSLLLLNSALEWLLQNTTLKIDLDNIETIKALPSAAKLFILKFFDVMSMDNRVISESLNGMSQTFNTAKKDELIWQYATELLKGYLKSSVEVIPACKRW